jgi:hypothetical protein
MDESQAVIDSYQRSALAYFERHTHARTGLVADSSGADADASIAGSGMALSSLVVAAERGWIDRAAAAERALMMLRFLAGTESSGTHGFYFHFLDPANGTRAGKCEVSTMDSALLFAGALTASAYFTLENATETGIRSLGEELYLRADWQWASPRGPVVSHGWTPEHGFLPYDWRGYNEALLLYILALGSPTYPVASAAYDHWLAYLKFKYFYCHRLVYG